MNRLTLMLVLLAFAGIGIITLTGCPAPNMNDPAGDTLDNDTGDATSPGDRPDDDTGAPDAGSDDTVDTVDDDADGSDQTDPDQGDDSSTPQDDDAPPPDGDGQDDDGGGGGDGGDGGGGGGGGGGTPPGDDGDEPPPEPCTVLLDGFGTNPGDGQGELFTLNVQFDGPNGASVTIHPIIPIFGGTSLDITPSSVGEVTFACDDLVHLGEVVYTDQFGDTASPGEITLQRGTDFACGQPVTIRFSMPCDIALMP